VPERIRIALGQFRELTDEQLTFAKQLGITDIQMNTPSLPGEKRWEFNDLVQLYQRCVDAGVTLAAIENVPVRFYEAAMLGLPGRDEAIENYQYIIRCFGRIGIPILGYHWMPNSVWRTSRSTPDRGGAQVTSFDMELAKDAPYTHGRVFTAEEMWNNWVYFMKAVLPVAQESNVKLALHPDDPPVPMLGGVARIFGSFEGFKRAMDEFDSPYNSLDFCQGCWSEMMGPKLFDAIRHFAGRGRILYVHFRDVIGTVPKFQETFIGRGNVDMWKALQVYRDSGFTGFILDDHVPRIVNDSPWGHRSRAYAIGYMQAMLDRLYAEG